MASATSLAAALARSAGVRHLAVALALAVAAAAPAGAADQVYVWRDPSGAVRFSPVQSAAPPRQARDDDKPPVTVERRAPAVVVAHP